MDTAQPLIDWAELLKPILAVVASVTGTLASALLVKLLKRVGVEVTQAQAEAIRNSLMVGALAAEEQSATRLKTTGSAMSSDEKRDLALRIASAQNPKVPISTLVERLPAVLPTIGLGAAAAAEAQAQGKQ